MKNMIELAKSILEGEAFTEMNVRLARSTNALCAETYAATKESPSKPQLMELINRADRQIAEYHELLRLYSGGRHEAILESEQNIESLREFTNSLIQIAAEKG